MALSNDIETVTLPVLGMTCAGCAVSVESIIGSEKGVEKAEVNYATQRVKVAYRPSETKVSDFKKAVQAVGYDLIVDEEAADVKQEEAQADRYNQLKKRTVGSGILTVPVVIIGMFYMNMPYGSYIMLLLTTPVVFLYGRDFFVNAWKQAKHGRANMDTLVALSTGIAYLYSLFNTFFPEYWHEKGLHAHVYFESAAVIIVFILLGKLLEEGAKSNTSSAIKKLMGLQPKTVLLITDLGEIEIAIADVNVGDRLLVRSGEKIPVDGEVYEGSSYVDESMITGEPVAVLKEKGVKVFAGTINQKGSFRFKAEKIGGETMLAQIIKLVQNAQGSKAPVQKLVDKIAGIFVPVVLFIAVLTLGVWLLLGGDDAFTHGLMAMVTVLVIACPCALGLATPTAVMVGMGIGAEQGILVKDAEALESGRKINAVILDKTGTITEGKPEVTGVYWQEGVLESKRQYEQIFLALEQQSEHPLAEAIVRCLNKDGVRPLSMAGFESVTAKGVMATYEGKRFWAGSSRLADDLNISLDGELVRTVGDLQSKAETVIFFGDEEQVLAVVAIADRIKAGAAEAISQMKEQGIDVYMLTGDNAYTASAVAKEVGIVDYQAEVLPSDKEDFVRKLQEEGKVVAMIGDGINDSQALARADLSIAMGKGSDIAMDVAKLTLISSDLLQVPKALKLSRLTVRTIRQNLFWAFIYNLIGIPLAAGILYPFNGFLLNPMIAGAAMALSSVSVVSNSLRLRFASLN